MMPDMPGGSQDNDPLGAYILLGVLWVLGATLVWYVVVR